MLPGVQVAQRPVALAEDEVETGLSARVVVVKVKVVEMVAVETAVGRLEG